MTRRNGGTVLYTSGQVRAAIIDLFSRSHGRRVAIAAFVGDGAESYLPRPDGIELVCWPKAGGTNPNTLRRLAKKGVHISFADSLHMKVYWTEDRGAVITSANLSTNALGAGDLKELGVRLGRGQLDIAKVLASVKPRPMQDAELRKLDRQHALAVAKHEGTPKRSDEATFGTWYSSTVRRSWKLRCWMDEVSQSTISKALVRTQYAIPSPEWTLACPHRCISRGDWVLTCRLTDSRITRVGWMFADHVLRVPRTDRSYDKQWPSEVIQVWPARRYPPPPFRVDRSFVSAFRKAIKKFGIERIEAMKTGRPPRMLVDLVAAEYAR